ncbi:MAG: type II toxin-antitoxin system Phd/YefM family antitoxin [Bacilli bacterium]|nr:type II toxin-antitoxin system Phd/YefM family antitoxin [Bacilli bacterium]
MATTNVTELRKNLFSTVDSVIKFNEPVQVTTKNGNAILLSEEDYNALLETVYLMSQPGLVSKIKEGEKEKASEMSKFDPKEEW